MAAGDAERHNEQSPSPTTPPASEAAKPPADRGQVQQLYDWELRERAQLSARIHDGLLQDVIGAGMLLHGADKLSHEQLLSRVQRAAKALQGAVGHGRRLMGNLRPIDSTAGLLKSLQMYVGEIEARGMVQVRMSAEHVGGLPGGDWAQNIYRIVQHALSNAEIHAQATTVSLSLSSTEQELCVLVGDDGIGFQAQDDAAPDCLGLQAMTARAELYGGSCQVKSMPGSGTVVQVRVPWPLSAAPR